MSVATVRAALAAACAEITGLKSGTYRPDQIPTPIAVVTPDDFDPRLVMGESKAVRPFIISVYTGRTSEVAAQKLLDTYTELSGSSSILAKIQSYTALNDGTTADYAEVTNISGLKTETIGQVEYLLVQFSVDVCF